MRGKGALREKVGDTRGKDGAPSGRKWRLGVLREKVGVWGPQGRKGAGVEALILTGNPGAPARG